jgi:hypothetical protein
MPQALRELHDLQFHEGMYVSELLEVPTVVASTDLLGLMPASMGRSWRSGSDCRFWQCRSNYRRCQST